MPKRSRPIEQGVYVLSHAGRLKVGHSANLNIRLAAHRRELKTFDLLGVIPGGVEMDLRVRSELQGRAPGKHDWFANTTANRAILHSWGMRKDFALIETPLPSVRFSCARPGISQLKLSAARAARFLPEIQGSAVEAYCNALLNLIDGLEEQLAIEEHLACVNFSETLAPTSFGAEESTHAS